MKTTEQKKQATIELPLLPEKLHPTVEAFVQKKVESARESLKGVDLSIFRRGKKK